MKILVTGSSGHLGEALVRTLREQAHEVVALDILESPFTTAGRFDLGPRLRPALHGGRRGGAACGHPAQAACRHPQPAGFRRHQRHRHAQPAGGGGGGRRPIVRLHQHDQRVRRRAGAAGGRAGRLGHGRRGAGAEEHLRRHQGGGRGSVPAVPPQPAPALHRAPDVALLPRGGRRPVACATPMPTTMPRRTNISIGGSTWKTWSARICWRRGKRRRSASGATSSARPRRSRPTISPT